MLCRCIAVLLLPGYCRFISQSVSDMLKTEFPGTKFLLGPGLHRVAPGVEEVRGKSPTLSTHCKEMRLPSGIEILIVHVVRYVWSVQRRSPFQPAHV